MTLKSKKMSVKAKPMLQMVWAELEHLRSANVERDTFTSDMFTRYVSDATIVDVIRRISASMINGKSGRARKIWSCILHNWFLHMDLANPPWRYRF